MPLSDTFRSALVTGASTGIGAAIAEMLCVEGVRVWGTTRDPSRQSLNDDVRWLRLELRDPGSIDEAWQTAENASGGIDLLINNAGSGVFAAGAEMSEDIWSEQFAVLLHGPVRLAQAAGKAMQARGQGAIVNITSLAVEFPIPYCAAYNAAKAALAAFTAGLQMESRGSGVRVIEFRPGDFRTDFNQRMQQNSPAIVEGTEQARVWARLQAITQHSPLPSLAARDLRRALRRGREGVVRSGSFFQARLAPLGRRLLPDRLVQILQRAYFGRKG